MPDEEPMRPTRSSRKNSTWATTEAPRAIPWAGPWRSRWSWGSASASPWSSRCFFA